MLTEKSGLLKIEDNLCQMIKIIGLITLYLGEMRYCGRQNSLTNINGIFIYWLVIVIDNKHLKEYIVKTMSFSTIATVILGP